MTRSYPKTINESNERQQAANNIYLSLRGALAQKPLYFKYPSPQRDVAIPGVYVLT